MSTCPHQRDIRAPSPGSAGERNAHLPAAVIGKESDRIDWFACCAGGDDDLFPLERRGHFEQTPDVTHDFFRLGHATRATSLSNR
jgi:hypothetical protein